MLLESKALLSNDFFHTNLHPSSSLKNPDRHKSSCFNEGGLKLGHFGIFNALSISGILQVTAHNIIFVLEEVGRETKVLVQVFVKGHALITNKTFVKSGATIGDGLRVRPRLWLLVK